GEMRHVAKATTAVRPKATVLTNFLEKLLIGHTSMRRRHRRKPLVWTGSLILADALPDIGRTAAAGCSMIADTTPTAATNEIACGPIGQSD
ncbi:MAG: hypothetical protein E6614_10520, partial [Bradyrhizobium sp.]|nr:hypothetical protein [Bradyrhizobium sp.]